MNDPFPSPPLTTQRRELWMQHWIAPFAFVPFALMLIVHRLLGLSDAVGVAPKPGEPHSLLFNFVMIAAFYLGVAGYLGHTCLTAKLGWGWVVAKLIALGISWVVLLRCM
jgi:hypothetical protein